MNCLRIKWSRSALLKLPRRIALVCVFFFTITGLAELLPFPLSANQRGFVTCLERTPTSFIIYEIYLPPAYSTNGPALPIFYTLYSGGGGMVSYFQTVCSNLNIIVVGLYYSQNSNLGAPLYREAFAVTRDIRKRVLFDPTAEFAGGFSGGGLYAYRYSRFRSQHVSGVLEMAGWLGISNIDYYRSTNRVQTNLLVARTSGLSDTGALFYNPLDSNYLATCGAVIKDWYFTGGHQTPPDSIKTECLNWLLEQRVKPGPNDQSNSVVLATAWQSRLAAGEREAVLRECVAVLMERPRTWDAFQAQSILDDLTGDFASFRQLEIENLAQGDYALDMFLYTAKGAADAKNIVQYHSALRSMTGVTGTSGDQNQVIRTLLLTNGYPAPVLEGFRGPDPGGMSLRIRKDAPGLNYSIESRSNLMSGLWFPVSIAALDTNTVWSAQINSQSEVAAEAFRAKAVIAY